MNSKKNYKEFIFDIGANDGADGLSLALKYKDIFVHAFEANYNLVKKVLSLKKKIEIRKNLIIKNYKIHNYAISDKNGITNFNISKSSKVSSLNKLHKSLHLRWSDIKDQFKVVKKIRIKTINLDSFIKKKNINLVRYIHIDTQGHDLRVLKGLKKNFKIIYSGRLEAAINKNKAAYVENHDINDVKKIFLNTELKINKINKIYRFIKKKKICNEADIYFVNKKIKDLNYFKINYNTRYINRVIYNKLTFKDHIFDFIERVKNIFKLI